jgi:hypothetical protein
VAKPNIIHLNGEEPERTKWHLPNAPERKIIGSITQTTTADLSVRQTEALAHQPATRAEAATVVVVPVQEEGVINSFFLLHFL